MSFAPDGLAYTNGHINQARAQATTAGIDGTAFQPRTTLENGGAEPYGGISRAARATAVRSPSRSFAAPSVSPRLSRR